MNFKIDFALCNYLIGIFYTEGTKSTDFNYHQFNKSTKFSHIWGKGYIYMGKKTTYY